MAQLILLLAMLVLLWVLLIRPQRSRQQAQQSLVSSIEPGDEILTVGGLYGIVQEIDEEDDLIVEVADAVHVRIARRAVAGVEKPDVEDAEDAEAEADERELDPDEPKAAAADADGEERVNKSEDFVSDQDPKSPAALERR
ncbi:MAG TPA: preprotein translocase subunit YajC [Gaiella sp.]